jgi:tetratricopeptide (TPR) repeat protein
MTRKPRLPSGASSAMWIVRSVVPGSWLVETMGAASLAVAIASVGVLAPPSAEQARFTSALENVHLSLAELYDRRHEFDRAAHEYRAVLEITNAQDYWYAMDKLGWDHMGLQRYREAAATFAAVANGAAILEDWGTRGWVVMNEYVYAYVEIGDPHAAYTVFRGISRLYAVDMLAKLADLYLQRGQNAQAISVSEQLLALAPFDEHVCSWQSNIARAQLSSGTNNAEAMAQIEKLVRMSTALATTLPTPEREECHDNAASAARDALRLMMREAAQPENADTLAHAIKLVTK